MSDRAIDRAVANPRLFGLAWRNTLRNTRRTVLTGSAVVVAVTAVIFLLAYLDGIGTNMEDSAARIESGHVRITREGYVERERFSPLYLNVPGVSSLAASLRAHPAVAEALPRIRASVMASTDDINTGALVLGLELDREAGYLDPAAMRTDGRLPRPGHAEAMLGAGLAARLGLVPGDSVTLLGQTAWRSMGGIRVEVTAIGRSGMAFMDQAMVVLPLDQAQLLTELDDAATEVLVFARDRDRADALTAALAADRSDLTGAGLELLSWRRPGTMLHTMSSMMNVYYVFIVLLMAMAGLIIINTMLMSVLERTREMGMLAAMGMRRGSMTRLIVTEGFVIGLLGAILGGGIGSGLALWAGTAGLDFSAAMEGVAMPLDPVIRPTLRWGHVAVGAALGMSTGALAALYPARRAVRMAPADALRS